MSSRSTWASQIGFILSSVGAAVGLGAIWKFPYLAGSNGGSAFFFPYMILTFTVGLVLLIAEIAVGRGAGISTVPGFRRLGGMKYVPWAYVAVATGFGIMCFYSAVGGWTIESFGRFPKTGESVRIGSMTVTVLAMDDRRVERVLVRREDAGEK